MVWAWCCLSFLHLVGPTSTRKVEGYVAELFQPMRFGRLALRALVGAPGLGESAGGRTYAPMLSEFQASLKYQPPQQLPNIQVWAVDPDNQIQSEPVCLACWSCQKVATRPAIVCATLWFAKQRFSNCPRGFVRYYHCDLRTNAEGVAARGVIAGSPCGCVCYCHCDLHSNGDLHSQGSSSQKLSSPRKRLCRAYWGLVPSSLCGHCVLGIKTLSFIRPRICVQFNTCELAPPSVSRVRVAPLLAPLGAQHAIYVRKALTSRIQLRPPVSHVVLPNQQFYKALRLQQTALTRRPPTLPEVIWKGCGARSRRHVL